MYKRRAQRRQEARRPLDPIIVGLRRRMGRQTRTTFDRLNRSGQLLDDVFSRLTFTGRNLFTAFGKAGFFLFILTSTLRQITAIIAAPFRMVVTAFEGLMEEIRTGTGAARPGREIDRPAARQAVATIAVFEGLKVAFKDFRIALARLFGPCNNRNISSTY